MVLQFINYIITYAVLAVLLLASFSPAALAAATPGSSWLDSPLHLETVRTLAPGQATPYSINGNRDCTFRKIVTRPARPPVQTEISSTECAVDTAFGAYAPSGLLQRPGSDVWGPIKQDGANTSVIPIPNTNQAFVQFSGPINSSYLYLIHDMTSSLQTTANLTGQVTHKLLPTTSITPIRDRSNHLLPTVADSLAFSSNSQWMVVDTRSVGMIRVDMESRQILPFDDPFDYDIGVAPGVKSAITSDGRFALVGSSSFTRLRLYDLATCQPVPEHITQKVSCQSRNVYSVIKEKIPSLLAIGDLRFITNELFSINIRYTNSSGVAVVGQYTLGLPGAEETGMDYLAFGDSFTSGEGTNRYKPVTDTSSNKCHLSPASYPYLAASSLSLNKYESVACSGARIHHIGRSGGNFHPQASGKDATGFDQEIFTNFLPGYRPQAAFANKYRPAIITVSIGGNDTGLPSRLKQCLKPGNCFSSSEDRLELLREVNNQFDRLVSLYTEIKQLSGPHTSIYALGYPELFDSGGNCAVNVRLNQQETSLINQLIGHLNFTIWAATVRAGIHNIDVSQAFYGHRLCEATGQQAAMNGITLGRDAPAQLGGPFASESYHPTSLGHQLLAASVLRQIHDLPQDMPLPNANGLGPLENSTLPILQAPSANRPVYKLLHDPGLSPQLLFRGQSLNIVRESLGATLKPNAQFAAVLDDEQGNRVNIGTLWSDAAGQLSSEVVLPAGAAAGFYNLKLLGPTASDENIALYNPVYLAASPQDLDGNGVVNQQDPCLALPAANIDQDFDGIDDGCDGVVGTDTLSNNLYRARNGDPARDENPDFLYLERNIQLAKQAFGIQDYDPDGDGWSLVAKSLGEGTSGQLAAFWQAKDTSKSPGDLERYRPYIAARSPKKGCVQLIAVEVSAVKKAQKRGFKVEAENTNRCAQASGPDRDHNGIPDDQQDLYRVRFGRVDKGESADKLYFERNIYAAEALLGISDYSKHQDGWALLGISKKTSQARVRGLALVNISNGQVAQRRAMGYGGQLTFSGLAQLPGLQDLEPAVLVEQKNGRGCRVLMPLRLSVVKKSRNTKVVTVLKDVSCE